jgi:hypothetical protein
VHHTLGTGFRTAGVHQPQQLIVVDPGGRRGRGGVQPLREVVPPGRESATRRHDRCGGPDHAVDPHRFLGCRRQPGFDDEARRLAVAQDVSDLIGGQHEVDRNEHDRGARRGERQHRVLPAVVCQQGHAVSGVETVVSQRGCRAVHQMVEFGERQNHVTVDHSDLVRLSTGGPPGDVTERVAAGLSDHSVELHGGKVSTPIAKRRTGVPLSRRHGG